VDEERPIGKDEETEECPSVDEGRCGLPVIPVSSSKTRGKYRARNIGGDIFGYPLRISKGITRNGHIIAEPPTLKRVERYRRG
jgi:hypothetical protein